MKGFDSEPQNCGGFELVRLLWVDYAGIRRCRVIPKRRYDEVKRTGVGLASACLFMPSWGDCPPATDPAGQPTGEVRLIPDDTCTLHTLPWKSSESMVVVNMHLESDYSQSFDCCPRSILSRSLSVLQEEAGVSLMAGFECEFTLLKKNDHRAPVDQSIYCQTSSFEASSLVLSDICLSLEQIDQIIEQVHAESAPGQFEIVTRYSNALDAANKLIYRKETITAVAMKHGLTASFLPKLYANTAGNGCHIHFSLFDVVLMENSMADPTAQYNVSSLGDAFAAGVLKHLPALMPFIAAHPNSYHRIKPSSWSGAYKCWGVNNREAALRLVGLPDQLDTLNFELKVADATANPYLALTAIIAAGLLGIRKGYALPEPVNVDPGTMTEEERKRRGIDLLPATLEEAVAAFEADDEFRSILKEISKSETMCRVYPIVKRSECDYVMGMDLEQQVAEFFERF